MVQNPSHFIFSSEYITPPISYHTTGSVTNSTGNEYDGCKKILHNLPYTPLVFGIWTVHQDFSKVNAITDGRLGMEDGGWFKVFADSEYIYINAYDSGMSSTPHTYYYKIYAYAPPDYDGDVAQPQDTTNFLFNTDNKYLQIYEYGKITPSSKLNIIEHGLGYIPMYQIWKTNNNYFWESGRGEVTIRGLGLSSPKYDGRLTTENGRYVDVSDDNRLYVFWDDRQPDQNDFAYYQIYTEVG